PTSYIRKTLVEIHATFSEYPLTPHLPELTQAHDLYLADASNFSQGWEGWGCRNGALMFV
ncbi:MAG: hypothetical protein K8R17_12400, partial [Methanosarcinales archaeon]|nr:hypothetical protein [Methanosarcinales archaeon]